MENEMSTSKSLTKAESKTLTESVDCDLMADQPVRADEVDRRHLSLIGPLEQILAGANPFNKVDRLGLAIPEPPNYFVPEVVGSIPSSLGAVVENGTTLFLQGEAPGVGLTVLLVAYADALEAAGEECGDPRRVLYVRAPEGLNTTRRFLTWLGDAAECPISDTDLRNRESQTLGRRILAALHARRVAAVFIDHVERMRPDAQGLLKELMQAAHPRQNPRAAALSGGIGFVLASHVHSHLLFQARPDVLQEIRLGYEFLPKYESEEAVAAALRQMRINLDDLDLRDPADADIVGAVLELTGGSPASMTTLMSLAGFLARHHGEERPNAALVHSALDFYQRGLRQGAGHMTPPSMRQIGPSQKKRGRPGSKRASALKKKREALGEAQDELSDIQRRKQHNTL